MISNHLKKLVSLNYDAWQSLFYNMVADLFVLIARQLIWLNCN